MPPKNSEGSILIILVILLFLATGVLTLSKFLATSQANVETAIESRYQTSLSSKMDHPDKWAKSEHKQYKFSFYYPKQWVGSLNPKPTGPELFTTEKFLSNKVKLKITVYSNYQIPQDTKSAKFNANTFNVLTDEPTKKSAITQNGKYFYLVELTQNVYFAEELNFKGTFFQILKRFEQT